MTAHSSRFNYFLIVLLSFGTGLIMISYGLPYSLHPDESYIIKDGIKNLINYSHFEFASPMSLYTWCLILWYGLVYFSGLLLHHWNGFVEFQNMMILESGLILFYGRLLSVLLITVAHFFVYRFLLRISNNKFVSILVLLLFIFNPILTASVYWVKFDAATYLTSCILLNLYYDYFCAGKVHLRGKLYILTIILVSVRVEIACFFIVLFVFDFIKQKGETSAFLNKLFFRSLFIGVLVYSCISAYPVVLLHSAIGDNSVGLALTSQKTFEKAIGAGIINEVKSGKFLESFLSNLNFYLKLCVLGLLPVFLMAFVLPVKALRNRITSGLVFSKMAFLYVYLIIFFSVLLLFPYHATHYLVSISTVLLYISAIAILKCNTNAIRFALIGIHLFYLLSLDTGFIIVVCGRPDTRILANDYILKNTDPADLLAIETISMNGYHPLIDECPSVLVEKSNAVKMAKNGTGVYYELKSKAGSADCRKIVDVFSTDYFSATNHAGEWINAYDLAGFKKMNPSSFITTRDLHSGDYAAPVLAFYEYILKNYKLEKSFQFNSPDSRLEFLVSSEPYFKTIHFFTAINSTNG